MKSSDEPDGRLEHISVYCKGILAIPADPDLSTYLLLVSRPSILGLAYTYIHMTLSGCATYQFKAHTGNKQNLQPMVTGTCFQQVKISIPVPVPTPKPTSNLWVYPYSCKTLQV